MILLIGGTGTLGCATTKAILKHNPSAQITIFSRDELKQKQMRESLQNGNNVKFILGDVRDKDAVYRATKNMNSVFLFAALKHVERGQEDPEEFVKTDVIGTMNVANACMDNGVSKMAFSSTDKAVDPANAYGNCKALSEYILMSHNEKAQSNTKFYIFRWGNVVGSRGSVIHSFADSLVKDRSVGVTHADMTRFWIKIEDAVNFMLHTENMNCKEIQIPNLKSAKVVSVVRVIADILGISQYDVILTGMRRGEKIHENITSLHSSNINSREAKKLTYHELVDMVLPILSEKYPDKIKRKPILYSVPELTT